MDLRLSLCKIMSSCLVPLTFSLSPLTFFTEVSDGSGYRLFPLSAEELPPEEPPGRGPDDAHVLAGRQHPAKGRAGVSRQAGTNGAAIVFTEGIATDYESAQGYPRQARVLTQRQIDAWRPIADVHTEGRRPVAMMQIFHCGRVAWPEVNPAGRIIAPSAVAPKQKNPLTGKPYPVPDEMSRFDIEHVVHGFVETAKGAVAAGFDGVEIHGAHGYLITQFLSTNSNQRTDDYGGPVENRFRFAREIIRAVRPVVPADRLLTFRISNWGIADMEVSLFGDSQEWQGLIRLLSAEPIDAISVSTYRYADNAFGTDKTMAGLTREDDEAAAPDLRADPRPDDMRGRPEGCRHRPFGQVDAFEPELGGGREAGQNASAAQVVRGERGLHGDAIALGQVTGHQVTSRKAGIGFSVQLSTLYLRP